MNKIQAFADLLNSHLRDLSGAWLARRLEVDPSTVNRWCSGESVPRKVATVKQICKELRLSTAECQALLEAAGYVVTVAPDTERSLIDDQIALFHGFSAWVASSLVQEEDVPAPAQASWASRLLFIIGRIVGRITVERVLAAAISLLLYLSAAWLMTPLLHWPIPDASERWRAAALWAAASILLPALIAVFTTPDDFAAFQPLDRQKRRTLLLLKLVGAFNGFHVIALPTFLLALLFYYLNLGPLPTLLRAFLLLTTLLFAYIAARTTPSGRFHLYRGELKLHEFDPTVLAVFFLAGPLVALFVLFGYAELAQPSMGVLLLIAIIALIIWEYREKYPDRIPIAVMIVLYGIIFPLLLIFVAIWQEMPINRIVYNDLIILFMASSIILSETSVLVTLFMRKQRPVLTLRGALALLVITLSIAAIFYFGGLLAGRIAAGAVLLAAILFRQRYCKWLWFHSSFGYLQVALLLALFLWTQTALSPWIIGSALLALAGLLIRWALDTDR